MNGGQRFPFPTEIHDDVEALARGAARRFLDALAARPEGRLAVALAGGSTPRRMYELLADEFAAEVPWGRVHWFLGDERLVPPDSPDSNFRMAREAMLDRVKAPPGNLHPVPTEGVSAAEAADLYGRELARFGGQAAPQPGRPLFDVVLLGLGGDGHTASLFPGKPALGVRDRWAVGVPEAGLEPFVPRVSLTLPALAASRAVLFLVGGAGKREAVARIAAGERLPAALVESTPPPLWLLDRAAAVGIGA